MYRDVTVFSEVFEFDCEDRSSGEITKESSSADLDVARSLIDEIEAGGREIKAITLKQSYVVPYGSGPGIDPLEVVFTRADFDDLSTAYINKTLADGLATRKLER